MRGMHFPVSGSQARQGHGFARGTGPWTDEALDVWAKSDAVRA